MSVIVWIVLAVVLLSALIGDKKSIPKQQPARRQDHLKTIRIDHTHYYDSDEYECSGCGTRFRKKSMVCPGCGARFDEIRTDNKEFYAEMMEEEDWDEDHDSDS